MSLVFQIYLFRKLKRQRVGISNSNVSFIYLFIYLFISVFVDYFVYFLFIVRLECQPV